MKRLFFLVLFWAAIGPLPALAAEAVLYQTSAEATRHCPSDLVVWVNTPTRIYHYPGTRWYGRTKQGAFVCEKEAKQAGMRPALNGQ